MRAVASAACAVAISGCLIVRADEHRIDDPCPSTPPELLADANGPIAIGADAVYFVGVGRMLSRVPLTGGPPSELSTEQRQVSALAVDATDLYVATGDGAIVRRPLDGSTPTTIAEGFADFTALVVDDTSVVWASRGGLDRWSKSDQTVTHLDDASFVASLGAYAGRYYFSDTDRDRVRRTPPTEDLASAHFAGPLAVDERGLYYVELGGTFDDYESATTIHLIPPDGGTPVTTADELPPITALTADDDNLYFVTEYHDVFRVRQVSRFGGTVRTLACGNTTQIRDTHIAGAGGYVYWTDEHGLYRVARHDAGAL